jgi:catechol 2,3-dioxygenase-like lactoylglutathione lyase family enzyme
MQRQQIVTKFGLILSLAVTLSIVVHRVNAFAQHQLPPEPPLSFRLHHVTLSIKDVDRVSQWYVNTLGFKQTDRFTLTRPDGGKIQVARVEIPGLQMNISQFEGSVSPDRTGERQGWRHLALQVDSVDRCYQQLQAKGVEFLGKPFTYNPPGYRIAFFRDPEGNILELYQDL